MLADLTVKQNLVAQARPLPRETLRSLLDDFLIRYAHETTAIEGNTLSLLETQVVLENGITIGGKTLREHLEIVNVRDAWERLQAMVQGRAPLSEDAVCDLHRLLTQGILGEEAGRYRRVPVYIRGSMHVPPNWAKVPALMTRFTEEFRERPPTEHPMRWAALAHIELAGIHPFIDGNGRVSRMIVNLLLMRDGWPPALYTNTNRREYMRAMEAAQFQNQPELFVQITAQAAGFMLDRYLHAIGQVREGEQEDEAEGPQR